jgi:hypothetical protein
MSITNWLVLIPYFVLCGLFSVNAELENEDNESVSIVRIIDVDEKLRTDINNKIDLLKKDFKEIYGSIKIVIKIAPSGNTIGIDVIQNDLGDPAFMDDVEEKIKVWRFDSTVVPKKGISVRFSIFFGKAGYTNKRILGFIGPIMVKDGAGLSFGVFRYQSRKSFFNFGQIHNLNIVKGHFDSAGIKNEYIELVGGTSVGLLMGHYKSPIVSLIDVYAAIGNKDDRFMDYYFSLGSNQLLLVRFGRNISFDIAAGIYELYRFSNPNMPFSVGGKIVIGIDFRLMQSMQDSSEF